MTVDLSWLEWIIVQNLPFSFPEYEIIKFTIAKHVEKKFSEEIWNCSGWMRYNLAKFVDVFTVYKSIMPRFGFVFATFKFLEGYEPLLSEVRKISETEN